MIQPRLAPYGMGLFAALVLLACLPSVDPPFETPPREVPRRSVPPRESSPREPPPLELPPNPPGCEDVVRQYRENPGLAVDRAPVPRIMQIPPRRDSGRRTITVTMFVDEFGVPDPESIEVSGPLSPRERQALAETASGSRFRPAMRGHCWVPAMYSYVITMG